MVKKEKIFLGIGLFCLLGFIVSITESVAVTISYLFVAVIMIYLGRSQVDPIIRKITNKLTEEEKKELQQNKESKKNAKQEINKERIAKQEKTALENANWNIISKFPLLKISEKDKQIMINNEIYEFDKILKCELVEDGNSITKTKGQKKVALGKALVGGVLLGGVGAIIGGTSGKTNSKSTEINYCNKLQIKLTINDFYNPCVFLDFIKSKTKKDSLVYKSITDNVQKCLSVFDIILDRE